MDEIDKDVMDEVVVLANAFALYCSTNNIPVDMVVNGVSWNTSRALIRSYDKGVGVGRDYQKKKIRETLERERLI